MRKDRLLKLADFLETVPRKAFDMSDWQTSKPTKPEGAREGECGFAGCALGWGVHAKMFRGAKLSLENGWEGTKSAVLTYNGERHMDAAAAIFQITDDQAVSVFGAHLGGTPKQAAKRIRQFVKTDGAI